MSETPIDTPEPAEAVTETSAPAPPEPSPPEPASPKTESREKAEKPEKVEKADAGDERPPAPEKDSPDSSEKNPVTEVESVSEKPSQSAEHGSAEKGEANDQSRGEGGGSRRSNRGRRNRRGGRGDNRGGDKGESGGSPKARAKGDSEGDESAGEGKQQPGKDGRQRNRRSRKSRREQREKEREREAAILEAAPAVELAGLVEISPKGFGFLRQKERNYQQSPEDVFITPEIVRIHGLRDGVWIKCLSKEGVRGPQLIEVLEINGREPEAYHNLPYFEELTAINPNKRLALETKPERTTTRIIDLMTPIGRGQRGLIVAPPRTGKTTLLHHIAEGILENYEEEHLIIMLIDERPEEVTDFQRSFPEADIFASSNDSDIKSHTRMAQLAIERAKRLVEAGENVFILLDSITRLARAFNNSTGGGKKRGTQSGGIAVGALEIPRKLFAAARNTREAGALTIIGTALIQTNSRMDEAIFQEFKGTGNLELVLDRQLSQNYVYPAIDIHKSGTRREELLLPAHQLEKIHVIRRGLAGYKPMEAMEWLLTALGKYPNNAQMLLDIKVSAVA